MRSWSLIVAVAVCSSPCLARADPWQDVAALWPGAHVQEVRYHGKTRRVIAPVKRNGKIGFIDRVESVPCDDGTVYGFSISLADPPADVAGWIVGKSAPVKILSVGAVILKARGKIAKAEGFPVERTIDGVCTGDVCDTTPVFLGLARVDAISSMAAVTLSPSAWKREVRVFKKNAGALSLFASHDVAGSIGGETGCSGGTEILGFRYDVSSHRVTAREKTTCTCAAARDCKGLGYAAGEHTSDVLLGAAPPTTGGVDLSTWPRMSAVDFGCMMEKRFGHKDKRYHCGSAPPPDANPCTDPGGWGAGPAFPADKASAVGADVDSVSLDWEHGDLQAVNVTLNKGVPLARARGALGLPDDAHKPSNVQSVSVQQCSRDQVCVILEGFEHMGAGDLDCP